MPMDSYCFFGDGSNLLGRRGVYDADGCVALVDDEQGLGRETRWGQPEGKSTERQEEAGEDNVSHRQTSIPLSYSFGIGVHPQEFG